MSVAREIPPRTLFDQRRASDPRASAWVTANAGSGKTHVLTQRVVRLLLSGVAPAKILCLTFTKAAAANMAMRVYRTLAAWTTLDDAALFAAIENLSGAQPDVGAVAFARKLFARTIETPGGLKIQTIHAFCESLLHRFPFEANTPAEFEILDDESKRALLERARRDALAYALDGDARAESLRLLADSVSAASFEKVLAEALALRGVLSSELRSETNESFVRKLRRGLGLGPEETAASLERRLLEDGDLADWTATAAFLESGGPADAKLGRRLRDALVAQSSSERLAHYLAAFLTEADQPRKTMATAALQKRDPELCKRLESERDRVFLLLDRLKSARTVERTSALIAIVQDIFARYEALKTRRGQLDFDDLIERTHRLVMRSDASWVLYKLDSGVDHILVDEAQDTSRAQWDILRALVEEFTAGEGARGSSRSIFAVGDEKQSIYSFQGAAPKLFDSMRRFFERRHLDAEKPFASVTLNLSFRSAKGVLAAVDQVFSDPSRRRGLSAGDEAPPVHEAWKLHLPGRVEVWEPLTPAEAADPSDWRLPLDVLGGSDPNRLLAERIADMLKTWLAPGSQEVVHDDDGPRPVAPRDILILVRKRGAIFESLARALKDRRLAVAGADRLKLTEHIAVMDLMAAGRAALLTRDDLSLACVLKSPLIGLDDSDLLSVAPNRVGSLWTALRDSPHPRHRAAARRIAGWRGRAALTPFDFFSHILGAEGGRRKLIARLGLEAADAVDEFLSLALDDSRSKTPSLTTFLHQIEASDIAVKRDMEAAGDAIRVMTTHAAKGLEAKIVILPDTCSAASGRHDPKLYLLDSPDGPLPIYNPTRSEEPLRLAEARESARRRQEEEHRRLLYVAMTRAEERLIVAGAHGPGGRGAHCWYDMIADSLAQLLVERPAPWDPQETIRVYEHGARRAGAAVAIPGEPAIVETPPFLLSAAPAQKAPAVLRPSRAAAHPAIDDAQRSARDGALRFGVLAHDLLRRLPEAPPASRREAASLYLAERAADLPEDLRLALLEQALRTIAHPQLAPLFGPRSRAEVAASGQIRLPGGDEVGASGTIDRLADAEDAIWIADFKTGAVRTGAARGGYVAQLALYEALAKRIWPQRRMRVFLVWMQMTEIVELPPEELEAALRALTQTSGQDAIDQPVGRDPQIGAAP